MLARGSGGWLAASALVAALLAALEIFTSHIMVHLSLSLSVFFLVSLLVFFRDPERIPGEGIVSPADGVIQKVSEVRGAPFAPVGETGTQAAAVGPDGQVFLRVQIFMNVHNVHVNRMPLDGTVVRMECRKGGFRPAFDKDADSNERVVYELDTAIGQVFLVQIAGAVARRIVPYITPPTNMRKGEKFGLIRLGSRVDVYLPPGKARITVREGMKVKAGLDTIAIPEECLVGQEKWTDAGEGVVAKGDETGGTMNDEGQADEGQADEGQAGDGREEDLVDGEEMNDNGKSGGEGI